MDVKLLEVIADEDNATARPITHVPVCDGCQRSATDAMTLIHWARQWFLVHDIHYCRWALVQRCGLEYRMPVGSSASWD